jgi:hypothetical protein
MPVGENGIYKHSRKTLRITGFQDFVHCPAFLVNLAEATLVKWADL